MNQEEIIEDEIPQSSKKRIVKFIINILIFLFLIFLTFKILLRNENLNTLYETIASSDIKFVLLGLFFMFLYYSGEAINLRRTLNALSEKCSYFKSMKYVFIGIFFNAITPSSSGGQAMQIYFMHKLGVKVHKSTTALLLNLFSMQIVTISMELISVLFLHDYMDSGIVVLFIFGIIINLSELVLIIIGMYSPKLSTSLVNFVARVLKKFKIKNYEKVKNRMEVSLEQYHESSKFIRSDKKMIFKHLVVTYLQHIAYYSVPFCVLYAFRLPPRSYVLMVALQSIVFGTVSGIPSPGSVGVSEVAFQSLFWTIFTETYINSAMVLHRVISFYFPVLICTFVVGGLFMVINKEKLKEDMLKKKEYLKNKTIHKDKS